MHHDGGDREVDPPAAVLRVLSTALARAVRDARFRRRLSAAPVDSGSAFEFPERLELLEIVCDVHDATVVCNLAELNAHIYSVGRLFRLDDAHNSCEE